MKLQTYPDREFLMLGLANVIASQLADFLRREGRASLSVPGGTTPGPIFDTLSGVDIDWANISVFLNDERWVGEDSPRSNTRLLRERLLKGKAAAANWQKASRRICRSRSCFWAWGRICIRQASSPVPTVWPKGWLRTLRSFCPCGLRRQESRASP